MQRSQEMLADVLRLAKQLSPLEKVQLIERIAPDVEAALTPEGSPARRRGLRGLLQGCDISEAEIDDARRQGWRGFPREDV